VGWEGADSELGEQASARIRSCAIAGLLDTSIGLEKVFVFSKHSSTHALEVSSSVEEPADEI
jgi:hypothetical protein